MPSRSTIQDHSPATAILVFARSAQRESAVKGFYRLAGKKGGIQLAQHLIDQTKREAARTGLPVLLHPSEEQQGITFGQRLVHAIESAFSQGFSQLIITGTDHPLMGREQLLQLHRMLETAPIAITPATDGGIALLALHRSAFSAEALEALPWGEAGLCHALQRWAYRESLAVVTTLEIGDIDSPEEILQHARQHSLHPLSLLVQGLTDRPALPLPYSGKLFIYNHPSGSLLLRGPPKV